MKLAGKNLAPVDPLRQLGSEPRSYERSRLAELIRELHLETVDKDLTIRREIAEVGRMMANIRTGKLELRRDPFYGSFSFLKPLPHRPRKDAHVFPLAQVNSSQLTSVWTLSRPRCRVKHFGNSVMANIQASQLETIWGHYDAEYTSDELFNQRESLMMQDYGTAVYRIEYDDKLNKMADVIPVMEEKSSSSIRGINSAANARSRRRRNSFRSRASVARCPQCGSYNVSDAVQAQTAAVPQIVGYEGISGRYQHQPDRCPGRELGYAEDGA